MRTKGQLSTGGIFNPGSDSPTQWLWSEKSPGNASGNPIAKDVGVDDAAYLAAAWNACDKLGLTAEQLEAGMIERLVASIQVFLRSACRPNDDGKYDDLYDEARNNLCAALRPFQESNT